MNKLDAGRLRSSIARLTSNSVEELELEAATSLKDLSALPGNRLEVLKGQSERPIQHPHQRSMADLL
jgi:plasmid maintenance system killer protein